MNALKTKELYVKDFIFTKAQKFYKTKTALGVFLMWKRIINFLYYFGVTPFKCEFNVELEQWNLKTSSLHKVRSLIQAWIPFSIHEMNYALSEVQDHLAVKKPTAKVYLDLFYELLIKFNYFFIFRTLFFRKRSLTYMLNHISETSLALERYPAKRNKSFTKHIPHFIIGTLIFAQIVIYIVECTEDFIPNQEKTFSERFYEKFVETFRNRFRMNVSSKYNYTTLDYFFGIYEIWLKNISRLMWESFDTIIIGAIPLTFTVTVNQFEEVLHTFSLNNHMAPSTVCHLFENLKHMSKHINSNWGLICLIYAFYNSTRSTLNHIVSSKTMNTVDFLVAMPSFLSLFSLLYYSGEVHMKIANFKDWLTDNSIRSRFKSNVEKEDLQRVHAQLQESCVGIGIIGVCKLNYGFTGQVLVLSITLFVINFDN